MEPSFELFDHTADVGVRVRAGTLPGLLAPSRDALYAVIGALAATGDAKHLRLDLTGHDAPGLLRDYLGELLVAFECDHRLVTDIADTIFDESRMAARLTTRAVNVDRCVFYREVKAITYHELAIGRIDGGYEATLILDI